MKVLNAFSEQDAIRCVLEGRFVYLDDLLRDMDISLAMQIIAEEAMDPEFKTYKGYRGCTVKFIEPIVSRM